MVLVVVVVAAAADPAVVVVAVVVVVVWAELAVVEVGIGAVGVVVVCGVGVVVAVVDAVAVVVLFGVAVFGECALVLLFVDLVVVGVVALVVVSVVLVLQRTVVVVAVVSVGVFVFGVWAVGNSVVGGVVVWVGGEVLGCVVVSVLAVPTSTYHPHPSTFEHLRHSCLRWLAVEGCFLSLGSHCLVRASVASQYLGPFGHEMALYASRHRLMPSLTYLYRMTGDEELALSINTTCGKRGCGW